MALPIRETVIESVRSVRLTDIVFTKDKNEQVVHVYIDFEVMHTDSSEAIDACYAIAEINRTQYSQLLEARKIWKQCKVHLEPVLDHIGKPSIAVSNVQIAGTWVEPLPVSLPSLV